MPLKTNRTTSLLIIFLIVIISCKDVKKSTKSENIASLSEEFLDFYDKFSKDSIYQLEHTVFPLEGMRAPKDDQDSLHFDFRWQQQDWIFQKEFDDMNGSFKRDFYNVNGVVVEKISDNSGSFTMERRFGKLSSGWHLIYYRELGMYGKQN